MLFVITFWHICIGPLRFFTLVSFVAQCINYVSLYRLSGGVLVVLFSGFVSTFCKGQLKTVTLHSVQLCFFVLRLLLADPWD